MKECTAAMVLMNLSASPRDKWFDDYHNILSLSNAASSEETCSTSPITPRPSPATSCSHLPLDEDEEPYKRTKRCSVIFECTWRGCFQRDSCQQGIERHVRQHLGLPEPGPDTVRDYEEEFYYTEIEQDNSNESFNESGSEKSGEDHGENINIDVVTSSQLEQNLTSPSFSPPSVQRESSPEMTLSSSSSSAALGDHIGMVRPSYEAPTTIYVVNNLQSASASGSKAGHNFLNVPYSLQVRISFSTNTVLYLV